MSRNQISASKPVADRMTTASSRRSMCGWLRPSGATLVLQALPVALATLVLVLLGIST